MIIAPLGIVFRGMYECCRSEVVYSTPAIHYQEEKILNSPPRKPATVLQ